jgi:hypothetical protein
MFMNYQRRRRKVVRLLCISFASNHRHFVDSVHQAYQHYKSFSPSARLARSGLLFRFAGLSILLAPPGWLNRIGNGLEHTYQCRCHIGDDANRSESD